ncbi:hypothetical protein D918_01653 [Trichuris suis]|nr:hypothetical protein D918_01653 [Trichuris suis]
MSSNQNTNTSTQQQATPQKPPPMVYVCGDCAYENEIRPKDAIRCRECGYRVLYKKRTRREMVFDAR